MKHDTLGRRPRDKRVPTGETVLIQPRDLMWFEMLHRHGALPFPYLHEFTKGSERFLIGASRRTKVLFHEGYLTRPYQQFVTLNARYQTLVYDLSPKGEQLLKGAGTWRELAPRTASTHWAHDFMLACITASIHIATLGTEYRFIFEDEILARAGAEKREFDVGYTTASGKTFLLRPDRFFGIEYPTGDTRLFVVEADRGTETQMSDQGRKTIERNAEQYKRFIGGHLYKDVFKTRAGMLVLHVTTSEQRMRNMMAVTDRVIGPNTYSLFTYLPQFSRYFKPPKVLNHLFTDPLLRVGKDAFSIGQGR